MRNIKLVLLAATFGLLSNAVGAQSIKAPAGTYVNDNTHTNVFWSVNHMGLSNYVGRFDKIKATLELDSSDVTKSKLTAVIDPTSVNTNYPKEETGRDFNKEIAGEKFFDAGKFPEITFVSTKIEVKDEKTGTVTGDLSFHGITKPVTLDVTFNTALDPHPMAKKPAVGFSATGTIKRSDFGVKYAIGGVSDDVKLTIETEFFRQ